MSWRDRCGDKLVSPEAAVERVKAGDVVGIAPFTCSPLTLCEALMERA